MKLEIFETLHGFIEMFVLLIEKFRVSNKTNLQVKVKQLSVDIQWKFIFHFLDSTMFNKKEYHHRYIENENVYESHDELL